MVFRHHDITNINSECGKYKLVYKRKHCCDNCHFFAIETVFISFRMDLSAKFQTVSDNQQFAETVKPKCAEFNKLYPIMEANIHMYLGSIPIVTLTIRLTDDNAKDLRVGYCSLSPAYSRVVDDYDIAQINANPARFKLIFRKKNCGCDYCYFFEIET
jgi:cytochrome c551/c552